MKTQPIFCLAILLALGQSLSAMNYGYYPPNRGYTSPQPSVQLAAPNQKEDAELREALELVRKFEEEEKEAEEAIKQVKRYQQIADERELKAILLVIKENEAQDQSKTVVTNAPKKQNCSICLEDASELCKLDCEHAYCADCLERMADVAIKANSLETLKCPECRATLAETTIAGMTKDEGKRAKLHAILCKKVLRELESLPGMKSCPKPDCEYIFSNEDNTAHNFQCPSCQQTYCSSCLISHNPNDTSCEFEKRQQDRAFKAWKSANAKDCPVCRVPCERMRGVDVEWYGCNHMLCSNGHGFCWDCLRLTNAPCGCIVQRQY